MKFSMHHSHAYKKLIANRGAQNAFISVQDFCGKGQHIRAPVVRDAARIRWRGRLATGKAVIRRPRVKRYRRAG